MCNYSSDLKFQTKIIFKQDIENKTLNLQNIYYSNL